MSGPVRMDYRVRCQTRKPRDEATPRLRAIHREKGPRTEWSQDILDPWRGAKPALSGNLGDLTEALQCRHGDSRSILDAQTGPT